MKYEGPIGEDGLRRGCGRAEYENGVTYSGDFETGVPHGVGTLRCGGGEASRAAQAGGALNAAVADAHAFLQETAATDPSAADRGALGESGKGGQWSASGNGAGASESAVPLGVSEYTGEFASGEMTGTGRRVYFDGAVYVGEFLDGERHGRGTLTKPCTRSEQGPRPPGTLEPAPLAGDEAQGGDGGDGGGGRKGKVQGRGADAPLAVDLAPPARCGAATRELVYRGRWASNLLSGRAKVSNTATGESWRGPHVRGRLSGPGCTWHDPESGGAFSGSCVDGLASGKGSLTFRSASYDGAFEEGRPCGRGTLTDRASGIVASGTFRAGTLLRRARCVIVDEPRPLKIEGDADSGANTKDAPRGSSSSKGAGGKGSSSKGGGKGAAAGKGGKAGRASGSGGSKGGGGKGGGGGESDGEDEGPGPTPDTLADPRVPARDDDVEHPVSVRAGEALPSVVARAAPLWFDDGTEASPTSRAALERARDRINRRAERRALLDRAASGDLDLAGDLAGGADADDAEGAEARARAIADATAEEAAEAAAAEALPAACAESGRRFQLTLVADPAHAAGDPGNHGKKQNGAKDAKGARKGGGGGGSGGGGRAHDADDDDADGDTPLSRLPHVPFGPAGVFPPLYTLTKTTGDDGTATFAQVEIAEDTPPGRYLLVAQDISQESAIFAPLATTIVPVEILPAPGAPDASAASAAKQRGGKAAGRRK